jgi:hypothetical protein
MSIIQWIIKGLIFSILFYVCSYCLLHRMHLAMIGFELRTLVVIATDSTCSCKSNYHTIMTTMATRFTFNVMLLWLITSQDSHLMWCCYDKSILTKPINNSNHIMLYRVHFLMSRIQTTLVVIGTDCLGSCKFNYHTIPTTLNNKTVHNDT